MILTNSLKKENQAKNSKIILGKFGKIISKEKEMLSKKAKTNYKRNLIKDFNHQAQDK